MSGTDGSSPELPGPDLPAPATAVPELPGHEAPGLIAGRHSSDGVTSTGRTDSTGSTDSTGTTESTGSTEIAPGTEDSGRDGGDTVVPGAAQEDAAALESGRAARRRAVEEDARSSALTSRRRALIVSGAVLGVLAVIVLVWAVIARPLGSANPAPSASASASGPIQPTLLWQVKNTEGIAVNNALLSVGGTSGRANMITVPPTVVVDVATGGTLPFGEIARLPDPNGSAGALSDAIGVNVDATMAMDTLGLSGLVDALGGVTVDVDVDVMQPQADGTKVVLLPAGPNQLLQGPQAAAYATYLAPGEPEEARMARFTQVLRLVIAKLPTDVTKVEAILTALGASAKSTVPSSQIAAFLVRMRSDVLADNIAYVNLPVKQIDTGGPSAYRVDQDATATMVDKLLSDAVRTPGPNSKVRVLVQNGVGSPGLNAAARQLLVDAGFTYVNGGNAGQFGLASTAIEVPDSSAASLKWGSDIATALKVPQTAVQVATTGQNVADVIVVLGADFKPTAP